MRQIAIGRIVRAHGIKGEVLVDAMTPHDERFAVGETLVLCRSPEGEGSTLPMVVAGGRKHGGRHLLLLDGIEDRTQAEQRVGTYFVIPESEAEATRGEDEFFLHALVGRDVRAADGRDLGEIVEIIESEGAPILEIDSGVERRLLPFIREFVEKVTDETVIVTPPEGWEEL